MTERPLSITTQIATPIQTTLDSAVPVPASDALPVVESADEEPYTIKCICDYSDDDGNTIWCETCATWQHIECFYPGRVDDASREEFDHSCADCKPRPLELDRRTATERQRRQRQEKANNDTDKKSKRPPSKSHKKKTKPADLQVNGFHDYDGSKNGSPQEQQHTKKVKSHRPSQSISSQMKRTPPLNGRPPNHAHPPSPVHTPPEGLPNFEVHNYSENFLALYDHDSTTQTTTTNSFASLAVSNLMTTWLSSPVRLRQDTGVDDMHDVFRIIKPDVTKLNWPELRVKTRDITRNSANLHYRQLVTPKNILNDSMIGELVGLVGIQKDYCEDPENRWKEYVHPRPFVFFHPRLPLYIDTRREGSMCRYVRRSCKPNAYLETFILAGSEYHFGLVSERPLVANEQVTIPWDFKFLPQKASRFLHFLNLADEDGVPFEGPEITDEEFEQLTSTIHLVLSDYGGCACDSGNDCAFARFHRNYHGRSHAPSNGVKPKKGRKPKNNHISPTSTGQATNSRAASEGQQDQFDEDDAESVAGSIRSKPRSRDLTPHAEGNGILIGQSDREKRKLAMLEDSFRKMEQAQQPPRKKKRASDSNTNASATSSHPNPKQRKGSVAPRRSTSHASTRPNGTHARNYTDASTSRRQSGSPSSAISPKALAPSSHHSGSVAYRSRQPSLVVKRVYVDQAVQTDEVQNAWWTEPKSKPVRAIVPLAKRLLKNRHRWNKAQQAAVSKESEDKNVPASPRALMDIDVPTHDAESPTETKDRIASVSSPSPSIENATISTDIHMADVPTVNVSSTIKPPPPPWPSSSTSTIAVKPLRSPDLRVQMPAAPTFSTFNISGPPSSGTPSSASGSVAQSPFGTVHFPSAFTTPSSANGVVPSPIKTTKKLSLSDYRAMRKADSAGSVKSTSATSPTVVPAVLKPSLSTIEEAKAQGGLEGPAVVDSPMLENTPSPFAAKDSPGTNSSLASKK